STPPRHRARCTHLQTQPGRIQPIDSSQLGWQPDQRVDDFAAMADCLVHRFARAVYETAVGKIRYGVLVTRILDGIGLNHRNGCLE
ncbi:hypothetical protein L553_1008, partial [Bordetella pertussis I036]